MAAQSVCAIGSAREPVLSVDIPRKGHERTFGTTFTVRNVPMCRVVYPGIPLSYVVLVPVMSMWDRTFLCPVTGSVPVSIHRNIKR